MASNKNSLKKLYRLLLNGIRDTKKLETRINNHFDKKAKKDLEQIARLAIDQFYESYNPIYYRRYGDLYNAYKAKADRESWEILYDDSYMQFSHHQDNEIVFHNTFELGFHGGSWGKDTDFSNPHWRTPYLYYTEWWDDEAAHSVPPIEIIEKEYEEYMQKTPKEMQKVFDDNADEIIIAPIQNQIDIMRR